MKGYYQKAFPLVSIPCVLGKLTRYDSINFYYYFHAFRETIYFINNTIFSFYLNSDKRVEKFDEELKKLRLISLKRSYFLAYEIYQYLLEVYPEFNFVSDDDDIQSLVSKWLDLYEEILKNNGFNADHVASSLELETLILKLVNWNDFSFYIVKGRKGKRLHPFSDLMEEITFAEKNCGDRTLIAAVHHPSNSVVELGNFYMEYEERIYRFHSGVLKKNFIFPFDSYIFFSSDDFDFKEEVFHLDSELLRRALNESVFSDKFEFLGKSGSSYLVYDRKEQGFRLIAVPASDDEVLKFRKLREFSHKNILRFTLLPESRKYEKEIFVSEPLVVPSLSSLLLWNVVFDEWFVSEIIFGFINSINYLKNRGIYPDRILPANIMYGADGNPKVFFENFSESSGFEESMIDTFKTLVSMFPNSKLFEIFQKSEIATLKDITNLLITYEDVLRSTESEKYTIDFVNENLFEKIKVCEPAAPDFECEKFLKAFDEKNEEVVFDIISKKSEHFKGNNEVQSILLSLKAFVIFEKDERKALDIIEESLKLCERNLKSLTILINYFTKVKNFNKVYELLKIKLSLVEPSAERTKTLSELSLITEEYLNKYEESLEYELELLKYKDLSLKRIRRIQLLAKKAGNLEVYTRFLEKELQFLKDDEFSRKLEILRELSKFYEDNGNIEKAIIFTEKIIENMPGDIESLRKLNQFYKKGGFFEKRILVLEELKGQFDFLEPKEQVDLLLELAELFKQYRYDYEKIKGLYKEVLTVSPGDLRGLKALYELEFIEGNFLEAVELLQKLLIHELTSEERADILWRISEIYIKNLKDYAHGIEFAIKSVKENIKNPYRVEKLLDLLVYKKQTEKLEEMLFFLFQNLDDQNSALKIFSNLYRLKEEKGASFDELMDVVQSGISRFPEERIVWLTFERLCRAFDNFEKYPELVEKYIDIHVKVFGGEYVLKGAIFCIEKLNDYEKARDLLFSLLEAEEINNTGLILLLKILVHLKDIDKAKEVFKVLIEYSGEEEYKIGIYKIFASKLTEHDDFLDLAAQYYRYVLENRKDDIEAYEGLKKIYYKTKKWVNLIDVIEKQESVFPEQKYELRMELASILESNLKDVNRALKLYEKNIKDGYKPLEILKKIQEFDIGKEEWKNIARLFETNFFEYTKWSEKRQYAEGLVFIYENILEDYQKATDILIKWYQFEPDNQELLNKIVEMLLKADRWIDIIHFYRNYLKFTEDEKEKLKIYMKIADIYQLYFGNPYAAISTLEEGLKVSPKNIDCVEKIKTIAKENGFYEKYIEYINYEIKNIDGINKDELYFEKGKVFKYKLKDPVSAEDSFKKAIRENKDFLPAYDELVEIYYEQKEWEKAYETLVEKSEVLPDAESKVKCYEKIIDILETKLKKPEEAIKFYNRILNLMPEKVEFYYPLLNLYVQAKRWEDAEPLGKKILENIELFEGLEEKIKILTMLGRITEELKDFELAKIYYEKAISLSEDAYEAKMGLAFIFERTGHYKDAYELFKELYEKYIDKIPKPSVELIKKKIHDLSLKVETKENKLKILQRALADHPDDPELLREIIEVCKENENYGLAISYQKQLFKITPFTEEKRALLLDIAETYKEKLKLPDAAMEIYNELIKIEPELPTPYIKLLEIYLDQKRFKDAINLIERFVKIDKDDLRKASLYYTLGVLLKDHTSDVNRAIESFNKCLDLDPNRLEAFSAIEELVASMGDVEAQVKNYIRMIKRIEGTDKKNVLYKLYLNLGKIYLTVLYDKENARKAFEKASSIKPDEIEPLEFLLEIAETDQQKAVIYEKILNITPTNREGLKFLRLYYTRNKMYDRVWNICGVSKVLAIADEKEVKFYNAYLSNTLKIRRKPLKKEVLKENLFVEDLNSDIGKVLSAMIKIVSSKLGSDSLSSTQKGYKIVKEFKEEDNPSIFTVLELLKEVLNLGNVPVVLADGDFFVTKELSGEPKLVLGKKLLLETAIKKIGFLIGKYIFTMSNEFLPWKLFSVNDLKTIMLAAIFAFNPKIKIDRSKQSIITLSSYITKLGTEDQIKELEEHVLKFLRSKKAIDIIKWNKSIELCANRFGFAVANDIEVAIRMLKEDGIKSYDLAPEEAMKDLLRYAVSAKYSKFKKYLGTYITIKTG